MPNLLGLAVVSIVIASRQAVGANQNATLNFFTKVFGPRATVKVLQIFGDLLGQLREDQDQQSLEHQQVLGVQQVFGDLGVH